MKVDVVVSCYKQTEAVLVGIHGLLQNMEFISRVIFVNDEPWPEEDKKKILVASMLYMNLDLVPMCITFLDHEHEGFGVCKSRNQGVGEANTDHVILMDGDCYMPPGFIEAKLSAAGEGRMVSGPVHHIEVPPPEDLPIADPVMIREDRFQKLSNNKDYHRAPWLYFRGVNKLVHRESYEKIGGYDERFDECNYEDYDLVMRWNAAYGRDALVYEPMDMWHLGDPRGKDSEPEISPYKSAKLLAASAAKLFNRQYNLYAHRTYIAPDMVNVPGDVWLPFECPDWIPDESATLIQNHSAQAVPFIEQHLEVVTRKLMAGGLLRLSPMKIEAAQLLPRYGLEMTSFDPTDGTLEAMKEGTDAEA